MSLTYFQGVIIGDSLNSISSEEIQLYLDSQFVSEAYRLIRKTNSKPFPLQTIFLTFEVPILPSSVLVRHVRVSVHPCIPVVMLCFQCQTFGYRYASSLVCCTCGESPCPNLLHWVNCSETHTFGDRFTPVLGNEGHSGTLG
jgi:hypothetical protein